MKIEDLFTGDGDPVMSVAETDAIMKAYAIGCAKDNSLSPDLAVFNKIFDYFREVRFQEKMLLAIIKGRLLVNWDSETEEPLYMPVDGKIEDAIDGGA